MTIKEVESLTGLARSNIRFYEKENLFEPARNEKNGYREYSMQDVEDIKKIAYLRTLGISIEEIRAVKTGKATLQQAVERQSQSLEGQIAELGQAKAMCRQMLRDGDLSYGNLRVEDYTEKLRDYWESSRPVFQLDSVSFLYLWGSMAAWAAITGLCLLFGILSYGSLPPKIPVQWSNGAASSLVDKHFIFTYPLGCIAIRYFLRPCIYAKLRLDRHFGELTAEYLTNYLCFVLLSVEVFSVLFAYGMAKNIVPLLLVDSAVLIGLLAVGLVKADKTSGRPTC